MSNKITNPQRVEFIERILRETFAPRFDALQKKLDALAAAEVTKQHPAFVRGRKDKELRQYIPASDAVGVKFGDLPARKPSRFHGVKTAHYDQVGYYSSAENHGIEHWSANASHPSYKAVRLTVENPELIAEYHSLWADFAAAQETVTATIWAYSNRAKFEADFPDLAKYLPKPAKVVGTAVAVQVGDVMEKLAKVGIPPATK